jgi:hypothetical protein
MRLWRVVISYITKDRNSLHLETDYRTLERCIKKYNDNSMHRIAEAALPSIAKFANRHMIVWFAFANEFKARSSDDTKSSLNFRSSIVEKRPRKLWPVATARIEEGRMDVRILDTDALTIYLPGQFDNSQGASMQSVRS